MTDYGRRIVVDLGFEKAVTEVSRAIREEGLEELGRIDVRDHFRQSMRHEFRQYVLLQAWSPRSAFDALKHELAIGTILVTTFAVYELADGESAVAVQEPLAPAADDPHWRHDQPELAAIADAECERVGRVLRQVKESAAVRVSEVPA